MKRLLLGSAALVFATAQGALGFNDCGNEAFAGAGASSQVYAKAPFDTLRALVVLASFPEEYSVQEDQCSADSTGWPDRLTIPAWAYDMIEDTNNPTVPGSITHFFYEMSDRDDNPSSSSPKHVIKGTVYPDVVELPERINTYVGLGSQPNQGPKYANMDVVRQVIPSLGDDAVNYDIEGEDDFFDFMFIFYRERRDTNGAMLFALGSAFTDSWLPADTTFTTPTAGDIKIGPHSGATVFPLPTGAGGPRIYDRWHFGTAMRHEYCHHLINSATHLAESYPFALMNGGTSGCPKSDGRFGLISSGFVREMLGWIDPIEIDSTVTNADTTIVLKNAATAGSEGFAVVRTANENQFFLLECRVAESSPYLLGKASEECAVQENFSGLLISHVALLNSWGKGWHECTSNPCALWSAPGVDFELATAMFDSSTWEIDPILGLDAMGYDRSTGVAEDLFQPGLGASRFSNAFTPYTNPNTNLYPDSSFTCIGQGSTLANRRQDVYSGISIYNIEWANPGRDSMRVSIRFDGSVAPMGADTIFVDTTWDGRIQLSNDLVVAPGVKLTIAEGSQIFAKASDSSDKVTLKTLGTSAVDGTISYPVEFFSSRDTALDHYLGSGENGETAAPGDWGGLVFDLEGSYNASYGYLEALEPVSRVKNATIADAEAGIHIVNHIAPGIEGVTFEDIEDDRDIYLDGTDVVVPEVRDDTGGLGFAIDEAIWDLEAPTTVVATNDPDTGDDIDDLTQFSAEEERVDLIFQGKGFTSSGSPDTDWVTFRPETVTAVGSADAGDDWGGIFLHNYASGSILQDADIGYAAVPLFIHYADSLTTVRDSYIHHFAEIGLWAYQTFGSGAVVEGTTIDRGSGLNASLGSVGAFLDKTTNFRFGDSSAPNLVNLTGASVASGGYGIAASLGKTLCLSNGTTDTLRIANTTIVGPGSSGALGDWSGIHLNWICGSENRTVEIEENWMEDLDLAGLELEQVVDAQVSCNKVVDSLRGISFSRDSEAYGAGVRFRDNSFEQNNEGDLTAVLTDASFKVKMGPETSGDKAHNVFKVWNEDTAFFLNDDFSSDVLDATQNWWYLQAGSGETLLDDLTAGEHPEIDARCRASSGGAGSADSTVNVLSHKRTHTDEPECPSRHPDAPGGARIAGSPPFGGLAEIERLELGTPLVTQLGKPFPNPAVSGVTIPFSLSRREEGSVLLEVFDVTGRRVRTVTNERLEAARYRAVWSGVDASGDGIAPGIYFVRFTAGAHVETAKVTVLR